jgi:hypothetical protein
MQILSTAGVPVFLWTEGVPVEEAAIKQLRNNTHLCWNTTDT